MKKSLLKTYLSSHIPIYPLYIKKNFKSSLGKSKLNYPLSKNIYTSPKLQTNNLGYINGVNGDRQVKLPKPKNLIRVNCLGASTTQNYLQLNEEIYSYPLELEKILKSKKKKILKLIIVAVEVTRHQTFWLGLYYKI